MVNFGDEFSAIALAELSGRRIKWSSSRNAQVYGIGSILDTYLQLDRHAQVFGSGLRGPLRGTGSRHQDEFLAVRGKLTRNELGLGDGQVMGDPGLVIGSLDIGRVNRTKRPVVVPHFGALGSRTARDMLTRMRAGGYEIVLPNTKPLDVAQKIKNASFVATSSLHGLVFANSLGTPAELVRFPGVGREEPLFKYNDYLSVFDDSATFIDAVELVDSQLSHSRAVLLDGITDQRARISTVIASDLQNAAKLLN